MFTCNAMTLSRSHLVFNETFLLSASFPVFAECLGLLQVLYSGCFQGHPSSHGQEIAQAGIKLASPQSVSEAPLSGWNTEPLVSWDFAQAPLKADHSHGHPAPNYPVQRNPSPFRLGTGLKCLGVSVSSIYTLCIFTTDQMIRMLVCRGQGRGRNFQWYFQRENLLIRRYTSLLHCKNSFSDDILKTFIWGNWVTFICNVVWNSLTSVANISYCVFL